MNIDVAFLPSQARTWRDSICIVVDVLRASSTIVVAFEQGASLVIPVSSMTAGRKLARRNRYIFCGDTHILGMNSFDMDNSPSEMSKRNLGGRTVVLYTLNGSRVITQNRNVRHLLIGSLLNARACCELALQLQRDSSADVGIICAGNHGEFALEDFLAAGYLVRELQKGTPGGRPGALISEAAAAAAKLTDGAADVGAVFAETWSGQWLAQHGLEADVAYCQHRDTTRIVPVVHLDADSPVITPHRM